MNAKDPQPSPALPRRLIVADLDLNSMQPGNRHLLLSSNALREHGWILESWARETEDVQGLWEKEPIKPPAVPIITLEIFTFLAGRRLREQALRTDPNALVYTDGARCLGADIAQFNFVNETWVKIALKNRLWDLGRTGIKLFLSFKTAWQEKLQIKSVRRIIVPSRGAAENLKELDTDPRKLKILPYSLEMDKFNPEIRRENYESARHSLGISGDHLVFGFISQGHFSRKGLPNAIAALQEARNRCGDFRDRVKLLVVGGHPNPLSRLQKKLNRTCPSWEEWIHFTGLLQDSSGVVPAMNAFLFPSYYETYGIVTAECAAMGVPLLITPHYGSEMTMRDGKNGLYLPWEHDALVELLLKYFHGETSLGSLRKEKMWLPEKFVPDPGEILSREDYEQELLKFLDTVLEEKREVLRER